MGVCVVKKLARLADLEGGVNEAFSYFCLPLKCILPVLVASTE